MSSRGCCGSRKREHREVQRIDHWLSDLNDARRAREGTYWRVAIAVQLDQPERAVSLLCEAFANGHDLRY